jgi:hypothetical protein
MKFVITRAARALALLLVLPLFLPYRLSTVFLGTDKSFPGWSQTFSLVPGIFGQTNLMVHGPGGYRFSDYLRIGGPLNLIIWTIAVALAPLVWHF